MSKSQKPLISVRNRLLKALPADEYNRLLPSLDPVEMPQDKILSEPNEIISHVYFPNNSAVSLLSLSPDGTSLEVGLIGYEGIVGLSVAVGVNAIPYQARVQIPGNGMRMNADILRNELKSYETLPGLLSRYTHALINQIRQSSVCNHRHKLEERFCKWLLESRDRTESDTLWFTQELLADMLGGDRSNISRAADVFQKQGLIRTGRGWITIVDRQGLEDAACECYGIIKKEFDDFLGE